MESRKIVIADEDEAYLSPLLQKLLEMTGAGTELEIITDRSYREAYFETSRKMELLILSKRDGMIDFTRHKIGSVVLLTEDAQDVGVEEGKIFRICRYSRLQEILNVIAACLPGQEDRQDDGRQSFLLVTSACGGCGKTTTALSLALALSRMGKRTLYVDAEWAQDFDVYLKNAKRLSPREAVGLFGQRKDGTAGISAAVARYEEMDYLAPSALSLASYGATPGIFTQLLDEIVRSGAYEYIVVDTDAAMDPYKMELMEKSGSVIYVMPPGKEAVIRLERFLANMNMSLGKCMFVCNGGQEEKRVLWTSLGDPIRFTSVLPTLEGDGAGIVRKLADEAQLRSLAYMVL